MFVGSCTRKHIVSYEVRPQAPVDVSVMEPPVPGDVLNWSASDVWRVLNADSMLHAHVLKYVLPEETTEHKSALRYQQPKLSHASAWLLEANPWEQLNSFRLVYSSSYAQRVVVLSNRVRSYFLDHLTSRVQAISQWRSAGPDASVIDALTEAKKIKIKLDSYFPRHSMLVQL